MAGIKGRRAGLADQRDRGRKRRRDVNDQSPADASREHVGDADALEQWLPRFIESLNPADDPVALQSFSIKRYLQDSARFGMTPGNRLRFFAIHIEEELFDVEGYQQWQASERLYKEAIRIEPEFSLHRSSRALTAHYLSRWVDDSRRDAMVALAREESVAAVLLDACVTNLGIAGQCHYPEFVVQAMDFHRRAIELDSSAPWPRIYFAYCLHDLDRWSEAVDAYRKVPKEKFTGHASWRVDLLREQVADCLRRSGEATEARKAFDEILDRYEKQPHLAESSGMRYLREAAEEWPDLLPRIEVIASQY